PAVPRFVERRVEALGRGVVRAGALLAPARRRVADLAQRPALRPLARLAQHLLAALRRLRWRLRPYFGAIGLGLAIALYAARFGYLTLNVYYGYGMPPFDLAIFDQGVWLLSRFEAPFDTIIGRNLFGDHTSFILLFVVPIYWVWPHVQALLVLQVLLIAGATVPIYLLTIRLTRSAAIGVALSAAYLLNPALQWGNMEQFHPESFLVLGMAIAIYAAVTWRPVLLVTMVVLCLLVKEDTALLVVPLGVWVLLRRNRRLGTAMILTSLCYMGLCVEVIQPTLLGGPYLYGGRIPFGGLWGSVKELFTHFDAVWDYVIGNGRPFYIWQVLSAVGFGFLWAPEIAAIAALNLVENYLSTFPYMHQIFYHYSLPSVPILVMGAAFGIGALQLRWKRVAATGIVLGSAIASCVIWGLTPFSLPTKSYDYWSPDSVQARGGNTLVDLIPPNAVVSSNWPFVAHIDHRNVVYVWPNPFEASNYGSNPLADNGPLPPPLVDQVQYVLEPSVIDTDPDETIWRSIEHQFHAVSSAGGYTLYIRNGHVDPLAVSSPTTSTTTTTTMPHPTLP
ncbi:MAG TPA: DUF2079 domain-containing protein, partial [Acidimicrobiales bacterium]|nr:DUF2079 domain-containing protein [Acidimicrobiales bacterium]